MERGQPCLPGRHLDMSEQSFSFQSLLLFTVVGVRAVGGVGGGEGGSGLRGSCMEMQVMRAVAASC